MVHFYPFYVLFCSFFLVHICPFGSSSSSSSSSSDEEPFLYDVITHHDDDAFAVDYILRLCM